MKMNNRLLSLILVVVMILGMFPLSAIATAEDHSHEVTHIEGCSAECAVEGCACTCHVPAHIEGCSAECTVEGCACTCHVPAHIEGCSAECAVEGCACTCHQVMIVNDDPEKACTQCDGIFAEDGVTVVHNPTCPSLCDCTPVDGVHVAPCVFAVKEDAPCEKCNAVKNADGTIKHETTCEKVQYVPTCTGKLPCSVEGCTNTHCTGDAVTCPIENCSCKAPLCNMCQATKGENGETVHAENCKGECKCEAVVEGVHSNWECPYYVAPSVFDQLNDAKSLLDFRTILLAQENREAVSALTVEEITDLTAKVEALFAAIEEPTEDDEYYHEEMLETLTYLPAMECPECGEFGGHTEECTKNIQMLPAAAYGDVLYFDLSIENVTIANGSVTGCRYDGKTSGHYTYNSAINGREIYVYQSNGNRNTGVITKADGSQELVLPKYDRVSDGTWGTYITNNTNVDGVISKWAEEAVKVGRAPVAHYIDVTNPGSYHYTLTIDNLWSSYQVGGTASNSQIRDSGGISFYPYRNGDDNAQLTIKVKGDNRLANIFYSIHKGTGRNPSEIGLENHLNECKSYAGNKKLIITDYNGDGKTGNTLTVANAIANTGYNYFGAAIGGSDYNEMVTGLEIKGATIFAGTTDKDNATAIGGGGNGYTELTISGGHVTAVCHSGGAAIGGGIGATHWGGYADVTITGGAVYAYNYGPYVTGGEYYHPYYAPGVAIGSGSTCDHETTPANVDISGGNVYAFSNGGVAIGGGGAIKSKGSDATISITGGDVTAIATPISDPSHLTDPIYNGGLAEFPACVGIGGGTGINGGGDCTLTISGSDTVVRTGSIGGGRSLSTAYKIGSANVTISDGAKVHGQVVMAKGAAKDCSLVINGATIDNSSSLGGDHHYYYIRDNGGVAYVENGTATVTNSTIIGGGTGGMLDNETVNNLTDDTAGDHIQNGGAIYVNGGRFIMNSGTITDCEAVVNGGAVYVNGGTCDLNGGTIQNNTAVNGGAVYVSNTSVSFGGTTGITIQNNEAENGAGLYINQTSGSNLKTTVSNGTITNNTATEYGGGIYHTGSAGTCIVEGSGSISGNTASNGGGLYVDGGSKLTVNGGLITGNKAVCTHDHQNNICGESHGNTVSGIGGGVYVEAGTLKLEGESVGLYGNTATFAADDAYAAGGDTTLTLPEVSGMPLEGTAYAAVDGWYIDYNKTEKTSPYFTTAETNPGRYRSQSGERITAGESISGSKYYCLTLGRTPILVIEKRVPGQYRPDETFTFTAMQNGIVVENGEIQIVPTDFERDEANNIWIAEKTISKMPVGEVSVTETMGSSTRFEFVSADADMDDNATAANGTISFTMTDEGDKVIYVNKYAITDLVVTKTADSAKPDVDDDENQSFLFHVKGNDANTSDIELTVVININEVNAQGIGSGSVTIKDIPIGSYTVTEMNNWSWRYSDGNDVTKTLSSEPENNYFVFENTRDDQYWLSGDNYKWNLFSGVATAKPTE